MDNSKTAAYADCGAGRSAVITALACRVKEIQSELWCTLASLDILGNKKAIAEALPRSPFRASG